MTNTTFGDLYKKTCKKKKKCKKLGYKYVEVWERDWKKGIKLVKQLQRQFRNKRKKGVKKKKKIKVKGKKHKDKQIKKAKNEPIKI